MRLAQVLKETIQIDNKDGLGSVPNNQEVDYLGLRVIMKPQIFLKLAKQFSPQQDKIQKMIELVKTKPIAAPFLDIVIPEEWEDNDFQQSAKVSGHEGRHRMIAVNELYGDDPIEVHLFFRYGIRNRDLTSDIVNRLISEMISEDGVQVKGPLFRPLQPL